MRTLFPSVKKAMRGWAGTTSDYQLMRDIAADVLNNAMKNVVKEAIQEAETESTSKSAWRSIPRPLFLVGIGAALGYLVAGERPSAAKFELAADKLESVSDRAVTTVEERAEQQAAEQKSTTDSTGQDHIPRVVLLSGAVVATGYIVARKRCTSTRDEAMENEMEEGQTVDITEGENGQSSDDEDEEEDT